jgi:hypothetical protein
MSKTLYQLIRLLLHPKHASTEAVAESLPLLVNRDSESNKKKFFARLHNIAELVATIPITNGWWRLCNLHGIGNIDPRNSTNTSHLPNRTNHSHFSPLPEIFAVGDWQISGFILGAVYLDHVIASIIKIASKRQPALPEGFNSIFGPYCRSLIWETFQAFALALKYYLAAVGWTMMFFTATLSIDDTDVSGKLAHIALTGCGSMLGILFAGNLSKEMETPLFFDGGPQQMFKSVNTDTKHEQYIYYKKTDEGRSITMQTEEKPYQCCCDLARLIPSDGLIRLGIAGLFEGITWSIMAYLLDDAQLPSLADAALLGIATYLLFCIGHAIKPNPTPMIFHPANSGLFIPPRRPSAAAVDPDPQAQNLTALDPRT